MRKRLLLAGLALAAAGCADSTFVVPLSTTDPPPANAKADDHCMQDCLGDNSDPGFCHARCAK